MSNRRKATPAADATAAPLSSVMNWLGERAAIAASRVAAYPRVGVRVFVMPERKRPQPRLIYLPAQRWLHDAADHRALGRHVVIVIIPTRPDGREADARYLFHLPNCGGRGVFRQCPATAETLRASHRREAWVGLPTVRIVAARKIEWPRQRRLV